MARCPNESEEEELGIEGLPYILNVPPVRSKSPLLDAALALI